MPLNFNRSFIVMALRVLVFVFLMVLVYFAVNKIELGFISMGHQPSLYFLSMIYLTLLLSALVVFDEFHEKIEIGFLWLLDEIGAKYKEFKLFWFKK